MEKVNVDRAPARSGQATLPGFPPADEDQGRSSRAHVLMDRERAQRACAPMGLLKSIVVSHDTSQERRVWYVVDPDPLMAHHYAAHGLELVAGCEVVVDAEALRPVAIIEVDPVAEDGMSDLSTPCGFNPYWDLPPT
jgi:hypothetical protein